MSYLESRDGCAPSHDVVAHFAGDITQADAPLFKQLLRQVKDLLPPGGVLGGPPCCVPGTDMCLSVCLCVCVCVVGMDIQVLVYICVCLCVCVCVVWVWIYSSWYTVVYSSWYIHVSVCVCVVGMDILARGMSMHLSLQS